MLLLALPKPEFLGLCCSVGVKPSNGALTRGAGARVGQRRSRVFGRGGRDEVQGSRQRFGEGGCVWEESTSIIPAASGPVSSTSMCTPTDGPTPGSFGVLAMAAFSLFFLETSSSWCFPAHSLFPRCRDHPVRSVRECPPLLANSGPV